MTKDPNQPDYIIRKRRSTTWYWAWTLVILLVLLGAITFGYWLNKRQHGMTATAKEAFTELQQQLEDAEASTAQWQQQYQIEHEITQQLKSDLGQLHQENRNLEKEREALHRIFDPESVDSGLQIASFVWDQVSSNSYRYRLMLIQAKRQNRSLEGTVTISIVGEEAGESKSYKFKQLKGTDSNNGIFDFTYVSTHTGSFVLPEGFKPRFIRVVAATSGRGAKSILQDFSWKPTNQSDDVEEKNVEK